MKKHRNGKLFKLLFDLSMVIKLIDGIIELIGGLAFSILKTQSILDIFKRFLEKQEDVFNIPNETVAKWIADASTALSTSFKVFISIILIGNGLIKILIAISLLMRKYGAFPLSLIFLIALYIYQIAQTIYEPSLFLYIFDVFDLIIILVIWKEYRRIKREMKL